MVSCCLMCKHQFAPLENPRNDTIQAESGSTTPEMACGLLRGGKKHPSVGKGTKDMYTL